MGEFIIGDIVVALFPFSNLKGQKTRPALVLANAEFGNLILCQITSKSYSSKSALKLSREDFSEGSLPSISFIRPDKLFTADTSIIQRVAGKLTASKQRLVAKSVQRLFEI
ncbi:MAG TPA: type II toxin-antitoxin system PemK/MazF family toxin [Candidatus Saccharimonadales bacterium]|nr:type II toxin-antitoxin system PemK/MazF family toxin [Candidatus Saccharimonadales bacterium]